MFRFILAPFFRWSILFPDILDFYKASEGGSYFSLLAFAICKLCKRLVVPWALSYVRYGIDQKPSRYSRSARFRCDWFLDNKINVIGELCAHRVGYHIGVFSRLLNRARWCSFAFCWSENAIEKNMHKQLGLTKYIEWICWHNVGYTHVAINKKLSVILNWKVGGYFEFKCLAAILEKKLK